MRKQVGMIDGDLLARVDACALTLGQTRRVFTERALEAWLKDSEGDPAAVMERRILAAAGAGNLVAAEHRPTCKCPLCKPAKGTR